MNILITGADGYIAKCLYEDLKSEHNVMRINRHNFDLRNSESTKIFFKHRLFDVVIHCAVKGGSRLFNDSWEDMDDNLRMYYNLLDNKDHYTKFIHFGSGAELYSQNTPYGLSKKVISESILEKNNFYNLRIFAVFNENELDTRFIKSNINRYIRKESMHIHENKKMDFIYMPDLIKIVKYYIHNDNVPKQINCNYKDNIDLFGIAQIINDLSNHNVDIIVEKQFGDNYISKTYDYLPIDFIGLKQGIIEVFNKLK